AGAGRGQGESGEGNQGGPGVARPGELRRSEVADALPAAALDRTGDGMRVGLEVCELGGVQGIADAQCEHDGLLFPEYRRAPGSPSTRNASIRPEASCLAADALALYSSVMGDTDTLSTVAGLLGEPARARILPPLFTGRALTAKELAYFAGVTAATASSHLSRLLAGHLLVMEKQGRCHYYRLRSAEVAGTIEGLMSVAAVPSNGW